MITFQYFEGCPNAQATAPLPLDFGIKRGEAKVSKFTRVARVLCLATAFGCAGGGQGQNGHPLERYVGMYEYVYEFNTDLLVENQTIVFDVEEGALRGWFFGTSDEFDVGREGYLPGFFVAEMIDLSVSEEGVFFTVLVSSEDCFTEPVPLQYREAEELLAGRFQRWRGPTGIAPTAIKYEGTITDQHIELQTRFGTRSFSRKRDP